MKEDNEELVPEEDILKVMAIIMLCAYPSEVKDLLTKLRELENKIADHQDDTGLSLSNDEISLHVLGALKHLIRLDPYDLIG